MVRILTLIIVLLTVTTNGQEQLKEADYVLHPKCLKFESKGKEEIEQCFFRYLLEDVSIQTLYTLQVDKVAYIDLKTQVKFTINEEGNFEQLEFFGSEKNIKLVKESFDRYLVDYAKKKKKIIPAKNGNGVSIKKSYYIPFNLRKGLTDVNFLQINS